MNLHLNFEKIYSSINEHFQPLLKNKDRFLILKGGGGSGKSHFCVQKHILRILLGMKYGIKHKFIFVRKTQPAIKQSVYELTENYLQEWGCDKLYKINKTEMSFEFINSSKIVCKGLDDRSKIKSIEGLTGGFVEEVTELTEEDVIYINMYLRGYSKTYIQLMMAFNPISELHWLKHKYFDNIINGVTTDSSTYLDNKFLNKESIKEYEDLINQDKNLYNVYAKGEWGRLEHTIYTKYDIISDDMWPDHFDEKIYGLDFGFNSPSALIEIGMLDEVPYERELIYKRGLTNNDLISELQKLELGYDDYIYADNAEPARIEEIHQAGYNIHPADKSVKDGIDFCKRLNPKIANSSSNLKKEIVGYTYKKDKDGNVLDEPVKFMDHLMDARRYAHYTHSLHAVPGVFFA